MTIKQKIQQISKELRGRLKKDGNNPFQNFNYFKPDDIQLALSPLLEEHDLFKSFNMPYSKEKEMYEATLYFEDLQDEKQNITYRLDIPLTSVKGASEAQGAGATSTYAQRYLLQNAFGIADNNDDLDAKNPSHLINTSSKQEKRPITAKKGLKGEDFSTDHKCSKCGSPTYYREGISKKGNNYKGYKCADKKCDNFDFVDDISIEAKKAEAQNQSDLDFLSEQANNNIPIIQDDDIPPEFGG